MKRWIYINSKIAQTTQINIWNFIVRKSNLHEMQTSAIIREISESNPGDREKQF